MQRAGSFASNIFSRSSHVAETVWRRLEDQPIYPKKLLAVIVVERPSEKATENAFLDRKSTRLNSSHLVISYAVFCLKKKIYHQDRCPQRKARTRPACRAIRCV